MFLLAAMPPVSLFGSKKQENIEAKKIEEQETYKKQIEEENNIKINNIKKDITKGLRPKWYVYGVPVYDEKELTNKMEKENLLNGKDYYVEINSYISQDSLTPNHVKDNGWIWFGDKYCKKMTYASFAISLKKQ